MSSPNFPGYELDATVDTFTLKGGCNIHTLAYVATSGSRAVRVDLISSTERACLINNDDVFLEAFKNSVAYVKDSAGGFALLDKNDVTTIRANNKFPPIFDPLDDLTGKYKITVPGQLLLSEIILTATNNQFSLSGGCNTHFFSYEAKIIGQTIGFGVVASTKIFCVLDQDNIFLTAFNSAKKYQKTANGGFILTDSNDITVIVAEPFVTILSGLAASNPAPFSYTSEEK